MEFLLEVVFLGLLYHLTGIFGIPVVREILNAVVRPTINPDSDGIVIYKNTSTGSNYGPVPINQNAHKSMPASVIVPSYTSESIILYLIILSCVVFAALIVVLICGIWKHCRRSGNNTRRGTNSHLYPNEWSGSDD